VEIFLQKLHSLPKPSKNVHNIKFTWTQCSLQIWAIIIDLDIGLCFWFSYQNIDIALRYGHMGFKRQMMDDYYPRTCRA